jgi:hypothetical protein
MRGWVAPGRSLRYKRLENRMPNHAVLGNFRVGDFSIKARLLEPLARPTALTSGCFQRLDLSGPRHARDSGLPRPSSIASTVRYAALAPDRFKGFWRD